MKNLKNVVLVTIAIMFLLTIKTLAFNPADVETIQNEDGSITKIYRRNVNIGLRSAGNVDYEETKKMLLELGMEQDFIDNLTEEDLEHYSNSTNLVGTITYHKADENNNKTVVSEEEAYQEVNRIKSNISLRSAREQDTYEDSYMRVYHLVSQYRDTEEFLFSTDARWLTMPYFRKKDVIGSCASIIAVDYRSASGYYSYDVIRNNYGREEEREEKIFLYSRDFESANNGSFNGVAAYIDLPGDTDYHGYGDTFTNLKAHSQFSGYISFPKSEVVFNSNGTYDHMRFALDFSPSISINSGGFDASIGFDVIGKTDKRTAKVIVRYVR